MWARWKGSVYIGMGWECRTLFSVRIYNHSLDSHAPPPRSSGPSADPPIEAALLPHQLQHTKYGKWSYTRQEYMFSSSCADLTSPHQIWNSGVITDAQT